MRVAKKNICVKFWTHRVHNAVSVCQGLSECARFLHLYSFPSPLKREPIHDGRHQNEKKRKNFNQNGKQVAKVAIPLSTLSLFLFLLLRPGIFSTISNRKSIHIYNFNRQHFNSIICSERERARSAFYQYLQQEYKCWCIWYECMCTPKRLDVDVDFLFVSTLKAVIIFDVTVIFSACIYLLACQHLVLNIQCMKCGIYIVERKKVYFYLKKPVWNFSFLIVIYASSLSRRLSLPVLTLYSLTLVMMWSVVSKTSNEK